MHDILLKLAQGERTLTERQDKDNIETRRDCQLQHVRVAESKVTVALGTIKSIIEWRRYSRTTTTARSVSCLHDKRQSSRLENLAGAGSSASSKDAGNSDGRGGFTLLFSLNRPVQNVSRHLIH